jgi:hypothetical protein
MANILHPGVYMTRYREVIAINTALSLRPGRSTECTGVFTESTNRDKDYGTYMGYNTALDYAAATTAQLVLAILLISNAQHGGKLQK